MRLVVDTNQAERLPDPRALSAVRPAIAGVSLAPFVLAELLLYNKSAPRQRILAFDNRVGLEVLLVLDRIAELDVQGIIQFEPFREPNDEQAAVHLRDLRENGPEALQWAETCKKETRRFCGEMRERAQVFRTRTRKMKDKQKFPDIESVMRVSAAGPDNFLPSLVANSIRNGGARKPRVADDWELYKAVLQNPFLGRFFKTILAYTISFSQAWDHTRRQSNFEASAARDDWTDITLSLYASPGDIVVTEDTKLILATELVNPGGEVVAARATDILLRTGAVA